MQYFTLGVDNSLELLQTNHTGLSSNQATQRLQKYGPNRLPADPGKSWIIVLVDQFRSPLIAVLLMAASVSLLLNERVDAFVIVMAVCIQVVVGLVQEYKAQNALAALKRVISLHAQVQRDDKRFTIPAADLVPGDILYLQAGDKIPADGRLLTISDLEVNEAALTGESEPVLKQLASITNDTTPVADQSNMVFTGTVVTKGQATVVVTATGITTEIGKIAQLIHETVEEPTPLQQQLSKFARRMTVVVVMLAVLIFGFGYFTGGNVVAMFTVAVAVSVSAIPEGLAVAVTVILAIGMQRVLKRQALVRKLVAAETLGSVDVICTDKTGTLTEGHMQVTDFLTWDNAIDVNNHTDHSTAAAKELLFALRLSLLCNDAQVTNPDDAMQDWVISGNLTERALFVAASQAGLHYSQLQKEAPRIDTLPFDSAIKYMATLHREAHGRMLYVKGAPEIISQHCTKILISAKPEQFTADMRNRFEHKFTTLSERGLRIMALAYKPAVNDARTVEAAGLDNLIFVGYVGIKDPLRPEAKRTIALCRQAGIATVMITGDHKLTAQAIARELGLMSTAEQVLEGFELDQMSQADLDRRVHAITVYARVTPQHKLRIVKAWQANGKIVAMTGDGINDSPAIKAADIGVALGSGTDVAKETADMVILDDNFDTIVAAVEEGRGMFDNIRKTVLYLISDSFSEVIIIIGAMLLGLPAPLMATQILWVNLVNDSFPSLAMTQEPKEPGSMRERPRGKHTAILDNEVKLLIAAVSILSGALNLTAYYFFYTTTGNAALAQTITFVSIGVDSLFLMFSIRSMRQMIYHKNPLSNIWLVLSFIGGISLMLLPVYVPLLQNYIHTVALDWFAWVVIIIISLIQLVAIEAIKFVFIHRNKDEQLA
ncbi:MAG: HAD-IC family P-type ATPase [Candidatus Kerfeldbacteria bacterium]|nr:HAD-IC family P-type ATPase [Candidatus Kerfeldbacteria bacterium]